MNLSAVRIIYSRHTPRKIADLQTACVRKQHGGRVDLFLLFIGRSFKCTRFPRHDKLI